MHYFTDDQLKVLNGHRTEIELDLGQSSSVQESIIQKEVEERVGDHRRLVYHDCVSTLQETTVCCHGAFCVSCMKCAMTTVTQSICELPFM